MTRKIAKVAVAATAAGSMSLAFAPPAQAQAEGLLCAFSSVSDPVGEADTQVGELDGGPLTATHTDPNAPDVSPAASLTLRCVIQVGATGATYAGPDSASASASGTGVVLLPPTLVSYVSPPGSNVYLCTELNRDGVQYYYDYVNGVFSTSSAVGCGLGVSQDVNGPCVRSYHEGSVTWDTGYICV